MDGEAELELEELANEVVDELEERAAWWAIRQRETRQPLDGFTFPIAVDADDEDDE